MSILEEFVHWENLNQSVIFTVQDKMLENISSEPEKLIQDLCDIEGWNARIGELLSEANSWLDRAKMELRPDKDFGSEMDRRTELDGRTASIRVVRDKLESLASCIKQRLILGESLLAYARQFQEHKLKEPLRPF